MPRDGSNIYHRPAGTDGVPNFPIESSKYNAYVADVEQDLNLPRPIVAGGSGANNATDALFNVKGELATQIVTNWDSQVWVPGSFYAASTATGTAPVAGHNFAGQVYIGEALANPPSNQNVIVEARDLDDTAQPVALYVRQKKTGVWSSWYKGPYTPGNNILINGDFRVNQIVYVSGAVLAAGGYGHDQWKAGASGGDYSFTQLKSSTQITIAAGKSLIQPVEDTNVIGGSYVLSWTGTAQARAGVNTLTPSGAYAASPLLIAGQTAGTVMSVEFNTGTLGTVKLESGTITTPFVMRPFDQELLTCQRYWWASSSSPRGVTAGRLSFIAITNAALAGTVRFTVPMRSSPAVTFWNNGTQNQVRSSTSGALISMSAPTVANPDLQGFSIIGVTGTPFVLNGAYDLDVQADARL